MDKANLKEIKKQANDIKPALNIGKAGISAGVVKTVDKYLTKYNVMKIKSLTAEDKSKVKEIAEDISKQTNSVVIDLRGYTFVLYREN